MSATHQTLPAAKPSAGLPDPGKQRRFPALRLLRHREMLLALASGALMCTAWGLHAWLPMLSVVLYITAYIVGGFVKAREGLATLFKDRDLDVNLLMIAAALGAASIGYWNEGAMLIFIFALSGALESFAGEQSRRDISALAAMKPETALRIDADGMKEVAAETLLVGDLVLVKPGEVIPADGIVSSGGSSVNQSAITGESMPVDKRAGDGVYAGTINGEGALYVEVTSPADGTLFAKIIALVEQAEREVPKTERFIKRLEGIYAKAVLLVTAALVLLAPLTFGWSWPAAFYKAMVFLVVASPCALVSSVMPAMLSAMSKSARNGVLFKGAAYMDLLGGARVVAFDKTGTLTEGIPEVTELYVAEGYDRLRVLAACAAAESLSEHPLAEAIVRKAEEEGLTIRSADELQALPGWGIEAKIGGEVWRVGKADEDDPNLPPEFAERMRAWIAEGHTVSAIQASGEYAGLISLRDRIRPQAKAAVDRLHRLGIAAAMLT
ncbi:heavy metal translocating P-type ATPase, partial [Paenibacillus macerans]